MLGGSRHIGMMEMNRVGASEQMKPVVTRFAPSPTGYLHIGGARTALFNWLFARHHGGQFLLRIEDTDRARSTDAAIEAILDGMKWLGLDWDGETVFQFARAKRHAEIAQKLLDVGQAYKCFATADELDAMRAEQREKKLPMRYDGRWRDRDASEAPADAPFVVRIKAPREGATTISDLVQGDVTVSNSELDDFVLLRSDGSPTYMLAVVVDDHDMGITHVIRGDDHLNNAFRQLVVIRAMDQAEGGWPEPVYAHVPLIHGADGAKLSKRHGALGVEAYRDEMGYLPEALTNYLAKLGWGHGDEEIFSRDQAVTWFDVADVGRGAARFDFKKLEHLNGHYIREADDARLAAIVAPFIEVNLARPLTDSERAKLTAAMPALKMRAKSTLALGEGAMFLFGTRPLPLDEGAKALLEGEASDLLRRVGEALAGSTEWNEAALDNAVRAIAEEAGLGLGKVAQPLRAALTGRTTSPGIFDVLVLLGREESLARMGDALLGQG
jgi:glutamyl-tRNA synthetase